MWGGIKGTGELIGPMSGSPTMCYCGQHAWSGMNAHRSQSGHIQHSLAAKARWEQFTYDWVTETGQDAFAIIGLAQYTDHWT